MLSPAGAGPGQHSWGTGRRHRAQGRATGFLTARASAARQPVQGPVRESRPWQCQFPSPSNPAGCVRGHTVPLAPMATLAGSQHQQMAGGGPEAWDRHQGPHKGLWGRLGLNGQWVPLASPKEGHSRLGQGLPPAGHPAGGAGHCPARDPSTEASGQGRPRHSERAGQGGSWAWLWGGVASTQALPPAQG